MSGWWVLLICGLIELGLGFWAAGSWNISVVVFNIYPTRDDRWYLPTAVYPRMWLNWAGLLESGLDARSISHAISQWNAVDLENAAAERGMVGAMCRTPEEWYAHPQGEILAQNQ